MSGIFRIEAAKSSRFKYLLQVKIQQSLFLDEDLDFIIKFQLIKFDKIYIFLIKIKFMILPKERP